MAFSVGRGVQIRKKKKIPLPRLLRNHENKLSLTLVSIFYRESGRKAWRISSHLLRIRAGYVFTKKSEIFLSVRSWRISVLRCILWGNETIVSITLAFEALQFVKTACSAPKVIYGFSCLEVKLLNINDMGLVLDLLSICWQDRIVLAPN